MDPRASQLLLLSLAAIVAGACTREERRFSDLAVWSQPASLPPIGQALSPDAVGAAQPLSRPLAHSPYDGNAYAVNEGKRLFTWFNCTGCHAQGGGGEGPALIDRTWRYGSEPGAVFTSIVAGRPKGMPAFAGKIPEQQVWQLVAYVRALGGIVRLDVQPGRSDSLSVRPPEVMLKHRNPPSPSLEKPR